ncbi:adenylate kinase, partial [Toxoplasma gondii RUB]
MLGTSSSLCRLAWTVEGETPVFCQGAERFSNSQDCLLLDLAGLRQGPRGTASARHSRPHARAFRVTALFLSETLIRAKMPELSQKKLKAVLDSPERLAAVLAKILEADTELQAAPGCLLVGYPATVAQASAFLKEGAKFEKLVQVSLPMEAVLQRLEEDEDQPDVDREEVERALNAYYVNEEALRRFFEPRGQLVTLDGTSPTAEAVCRSAFAPRVLLFPSAHLRPSFAKEIAAVIAQKMRGRVVDVAEFHTPDARGQAPDEDVFRDL